MALQRVTGRTRSDQKSNSRGRGFGCGNNRWADRYAVEANRGEAAKVMSARNSCSSYLPLASRNYARLSHPHRHCSSIFAAQQGAPLQAKFKKHGYLYSFAMTVRFCHFATTQRFATWFAIASCKCDCRGLFHQLFGGRITSSKG